jgi:hypothetical protein
VERKPCIVAPQPCAANTAALLAEIGDDHEGIAKLAQQGVVASG